MLKAVFDAYGFNQDTSTAKAFGSGLINHTWKVSGDKEDYILQRINNQVFKKPFDIAYNISSIAAYLQQHFPEYFFVSPIKTNDGTDIFYNQHDDYFRLSPFVANSHTIDVVQTPSQAFGAARQFGKFTKILSGFDATQLKITLPDFHNLSLRYQQFECAIAAGNPKRIQQSVKLIEDIRAHKYIVEIFEGIKANPQFKLRVTHHDTKISNVLFDKQNKGICIIDPDTIMPGYFISDVGDMLRTYLSPVSEEVNDFSQVSIRNDYFKAIADGYLSEMKDELTDEEIDHFLYAGKFMIYMQALRFLTDHLKDDVYYGSLYEGHNYIRAGNQIALLGQLIEKEAELISLIA
ncbi:MAG: aminoglycoside phosphotransferase family protein [Ferruginibacter sp.]